MRTLPVVLMLIVSAGCGGLEGQIVLENVRDIDSSEYGDTVVLNDGRVFWLSAPGAPAVLATDPFVATQDRLALGRNGEIFEELRGVGPTPTFSRSKVAPLPVELLGGSWFRQADGRVFQFIDASTLAYRDGLAGATACADRGCIVGGAFKVANDGRTFDGPFEEVVDAFVPSTRENLFVRGWRLLRPGGKVTTISDETETTTVIRDMEDLPPIAHLYGRFLRATDGEMWFSGNVVTLPDSLVSRGDSFDCMEREIKQYDYTCVPPTRVPALDHTRPADLNAALYAVTDSGQLLCFQKENGPPCPGRAAQ